MRAGQGVYVRFPFEALLAVAAQESVRQRCIVIGEDLGTVPEDFRETLSDWGIWSYQVMLFERAPDGSFLPPEAYRENALVTFSTHDLATFAGWSSAHDLAVKRALGMDPGETDDERATAQAELRNALRPGARPTPTFRRSPASWPRTPARLLVVAVEDALGSARPGQRSGDHRPAPELAAPAADVSRGSSAAKRPHRGSRRHDSRRPEHSRNAPVLSA